MPINTPAKKAAPAAEFKAPDEKDVTPVEDLKTDDGAQVDPADVKAAAVPVADVRDDEEDEYIFVRMPGGKVKAIRKSDVQDLTATDVENPNVPDEEQYVWLADGSVEKVKASKLPGAAGTNAVNGYFERDGKMHFIVAVYPVETEKG